MEGGGGSADDDFAPVVDRSRALRSTFALAVIEVLDEAQQRGLPVDDAFARQLTETAFTWATTALAPDLEAFAKHAKRKSVAPEDVLLCARKNEVTHARVDRAAEKLRATASASKRQKADTTATAL